MITDCELSHCYKRLQSRKGGLVALVPRAFVECGVYRSRLRLPKNQRLLMVPLKRTIKNFNAEPLNITLLASKPLASLFSHRISTIRLALIIS